MPKKYDGRLLPGFQYPRWIAEMTNEERVKHFRYYTPEQFLESIRAQGLDIRCEDPVTLNKVVKLVVGWD